KNPAIRKAISIEELIKKDATERRLYLLQEKFRMEQESFRVSLGTVLFDTGMWVRTLRGKLLRLLGSRFTVGHFAFFFSLPPSI
ncbi:hypothetical protein LR013_02515, partial [candidate division NPL-UPA2 bacterium]|nr:hypothetical protein [candidate division NPL-UPA2 bacterium]